MGTYSNDRPVPQLSIQVCGRTTNDERGVCTLQFGGVTLGVEDLKIAVSSSLLAQLSQN